MIQSPSVLAVKLSSLLTVDLTSTQSLNQIPHKMPWTPLQNTELLFITSHPCDGMPTIHKRKKPSVKINSVYRLSAHEMAIFAPGLIPDKSG